MTAFYELWETDSGNLINSFATFADAWVSISGAVRSGRTEWVPSAALVYYTSANDEPHLLMRGDEMLEAIRRAADDRPSKHLGHSALR